MELSLAVREKRAYTKHAPTLFEFLILCAIRRSGGELVDVLTIETALRRRGQLELPKATIYMILRRMCDQELMFVIEESRHKNESRMYYSLTDQGNRFITEWLGRLTAML
jgi:DNA-binding MarR family transcriptional regulator